MALVELARFYDSLSAGAARSVLASEGIDAHLFDLGMTLQAVGFLVPVRLMVDEAELEEAQAVLSRDMPE